MSKEKNTAPAVSGNTIAGAASNPHENNTTKKEKSHAELLFERIGTGKEHAVRVSTRDGSDRTVRQFRRLVAKANRTGDCIINTADGSGYYRPDISREDERDALEHYIRAELHRASEIESKAYSMAEAVGGRYMVF